MSGVVFLCCTQTSESASRIRCPAGQWLTQITQNMEQFQVFVCVCLCVNFCVCLCVCVQVFVCHEM